MDTIKLKQAIRARLPDHAFRPTPWRILWILPPLVIIGGGYYLILGLDMALWAEIVLSILIGIMYGSAFFFGHEVAHGAILRSHRLQDPILYLCFAIFCLSPHFWRVWHVKVHHAYPNMPSRDPDMYGTIDDIDEIMLRPLVLRFAPGMGHWLSVFFLFGWFAIFCQAVLINRKRFAGKKGIYRLRTKRCIFDQAGLAVMWVAVAWAVGFADALLVVVLPMSVANFCVMSFIITNHALRPIKSPDPLRNSMSVTTPKWADMLFFHFSHHVEHHLFPAMSTCHTPMVRRALRELAGRRYLAPPYWRALLEIFRSPRIYGEDDCFYNVFTGRRVSIAEVERRLGGEQEQN